MTIGIGLIGSGFIGNVHALAYRAAPTVFGIDAPRLEVLADLDDGRAAEAAEPFGFARSTGDWRPPPPVRPVEGAATTGGVRTMVGFNYLKNPITALAREIIAGGEIGEVFGYRGCHFEDYMHDPDTLVESWRLNPDTGDGVTSDLGSHAISMARYLVGDIAEVAAQRSTVTAGQPVPDTVAVLTRFTGGATGIIEASWMAAGKKHTIAVGVWGTKGSLAFDFERLNEQRLYSSGQQQGREGVTTILAGPAQPDFAAFLPAPGHQIGFNDTKTIEVRDLLTGLDPTRRSPWPDFAEGLAAQRTVDAIVRSDETGS